MRRPAEPNRLTPLGVYVHFPWCLKKCPYCDFLSIAADRPEIPHRAYADAVIAELERRFESLGERALASVFFGGGTPSLWEPSELGRVLGRIRALFPRDYGDEIEVTAECNPSSFDAERARALLGVGVNRVSIGVQALEQSRLDFLGRLHDPNGGLRAVADALAARVPRVSADLIFGVHGQSPEVAAREAGAVAELGVTHVSAYALTIEPGTQFGALARRNALPLLGDDQVAESFVAVDEALAARGFDHYEISNFARDGHRAEHNLGYWLGREYLGLGCGAWGTVELEGKRVRYRNLLVPERYMASFDPAGNSSESERESLSRETLLSERILLGLRLADGIDLDAIGSELGVEPWTHTRRRAVEKLVGRGRLERDGARLRVPKSAWLLADGTIAELI